jgi:hypothetical protein
MAFLNSTISVPTWVWILTIGILIFASVEWRYTRDRWCAAAEELTKWQRLGKEYDHREFGRVLLLGFHPHDGALRIVEAYDENGDWRLEYVERSDLTFAGSDAP